MTTPRLSFEVFPPKTDAQRGELDAALAQLAPLDPSAVSVTYGAGGTTQERSFDTVARLQAAGLPVVAHITCAGAPVSAVEAAVATFRARGVSRFVALRGDPPGGLAHPYRPHPGGFGSTAALVAALKQAGADRVAVSAYPERHPQSPDWDAELAILRAKVAAGADRAVTQFFFDNDDFERYRDRVRAAGIEAAIVPGIMPIHRFEAVASFAARCGASIPTALAERFAAVAGDDDGHRRTAIAVAAEQLADLRRRGVEAFHIYTLNRADLTVAICQALGWTPAGVARAAA